MVKQMKAHSVLLGAALALAPSVAHANMVATPEMIAVMGVFAGLFTAILSITLELPILLIGARGLGVWRAHIREFVGRVVAANVVSQVLLWALLIVLPPIVFPMLNSLLGHAGSRAPILTGRPYPPFVRLALEPTQLPDATYFWIAWVLIVLAAEAAVVAVEYRILRRVPKVTARQALCLALAANALSFGMGSILLPWWDVVP